MQCTVTWSPETGGNLVKPYHPSVTRYSKGPVWKDKIMEDEERRERRRRQKEKVVGCCRKAAAFLFSHIGLAAMVVAYSIGGGFLFRALEAPYEVRQKNNIIVERENAIENILNEAVNMKLNHESSQKNFSNKVRAVLLSYQADVVSAVKDSGWDGNDDTDAIALQWSFAGALLYAVTVITTIGYGHVAPKTEWGRLVTILYALVGIPLTFLYLSNIGNFLADSFRLFYKKVCCDICCCQKCERKKKLERLALRRRRELAAQRNVAMNDPSHVTQYGTNEETMPIQDQTEYYIENEHLGLPGGDENLGFEEDPDDSETETDATQDAHLTRKHSDKKPNSNNIRETSFMANNPSNIRETDILDDDYDGFDGDVRETAILDDDVDDDKDPPSRKHSKKKKATSPSSDIHVSTGILDKLGNARETDILDDSEDDSYEKLAPNSSQAKSSSDNQLKESGASKSGAKRAKSLKDKTKNKQPKLKEKSKSFKDKSRSKNEGAQAAALDKANTKRPSRKNRSADGHTDSENKTNDKDLTRKGSKKETRILDGEEPPAYSSHSRSDSKKGKALERGKSGKQSRSFFRRGTSTARKKETGEPSLLRKASKKRKKSSASESDEEDEDTIKQKAFHQSEESFVTAQGDSLSYLERLESDEEEDEDEEDEDDEDGLQSNRVMTKSALPSNAIAYDDDADYDMELMEFGDLGPRQGYAVDDPFDYEAHTDDEKVTVPISICLIIIAGYIFGGSVLFTLWEDWDYLTGSYFCFITLSTIGFGDIVPGTDMKEWSSHSKLVSCSLWLALGLSLLAMCFNLMQEEVKEKCKWLGQKLGLLKDDGEG